MPTGPCYRSSLTSDSRDHRPRMTALHSRCMPANRSLPPHGAAATAPGGALQRCRVAVLRPDPHRRTTHPRVALAVLNIFYKFNTACCSIFTFKLSWYVQLCAAYSGCKINNNSFLNFNGNTNKSFIDCGIALVINCFQLHSYCSYLLTNFETRYTKYTQYFPWNLWSR